MNMKIENIWMWAFVLLVALCNRVSVHGFTGSERGRGIFPAFVSVGSRHLLGTVTPPVHGANNGDSRHIHRPLQVSNSNDGDNSNENGVSEQGEQQNQQQVSKDSKVPKSKKKKRFAVGDELKQLRAELDSLRENLHWAQAMEDEKRVADLKGAIQTGEQRDPDLCYAKALQMLAQTKASTTSSSISQSSSAINLSPEEKQRLLLKWQKEADAARSKLPQFQLEGLWVGNYGDQGNEIVNVTYVGDTLLATKATGDVNVPRGEISFSADLSPRNGKPTLEPLKLSFDKSALAVSTAKLPRFAGRGQIAKPGFIDNSYVDGQIILFGSHFSFVWLPSKQHILFRRPTPEQTIELLRDVISQEDEMENTLEHLARCYDMVWSSLAQQHTEEEAEPFRRIALKQDLEALEQERFPTLEPKTSFNFWQVGQWRKYIGDVLRDDSVSQEEDFW